MRALFLHELKANIKTLLIWGITVGALGTLCILLYSGIEADIKDLAENFSNMGAFSEAFGMSTLGIGTITGYFATEVGTIHGLGGGMFAAMLGGSMLSKEEDGHTGEFLYALPFSRRKIVYVKEMAVVTNLILFTLICTIMYLSGFVMIKEEIPVSQFFLFVLMQFFMNLEIAFFCMMLSAFWRKNKLGIGLGVTLVCYVYDLMGRVIPDMEKISFLSPYSYANASTIFADECISQRAIGFGIAIIMITIIIMHMKYDKKDLAS